MNTRFIAILTVLLTCLTAVGCAAIVADDSDAVTVNSSKDLTVGESYSYALGSDGFGFGSYGASVRYSSGSVPGMSETSVTSGINKIYYYSGTPTTAGTYTVHFKSTSSIASSYDYVVTFTVSATTATVTYNAGVGTVNGSTTWSETVKIDSYASLPSASYSTGAYTFAGWSTSSSGSVLSKYVVTGDVTLYAIWTKNTVSVNSASATISQGQSSSVYVSTSPSSATLSISSYGGLSSSNVWVSGHNVYMDMTDVSPGTYYVTLKGAYTGYYTGSSTLTIKVPITIVKPIEYTLTEGDTFAYTPVTNPTNATITLTKVTVDGSTASNYGGLAVSGRTITGTLNTPGTYAITYSAAMSGYVSVSNTVYVYVSEAATPEEGESGSTETHPVSIGSIVATSRASEPRVFDLIAKDCANVSNYVWSYNGTTFASSSSTALYEFPTAGIYTVRCTVTGVDGDTAYKEVTLVCTDWYHREAAWSDVAYGYITESSDSVTISEGSPFSSKTETVNGKTYTSIYGTPSAEDVGKSFTVSMGSDEWTVTIYAKETSAPVSDFEFTFDEETGLTVTVEFTGSNASFYRFDFDNDGTYENGLTHTYSASGSYTIVCLAVNNISEVQCSKYTEISPVQETESTLDDLTDFSMTLGEQLKITLNVADTDSISVTGSATDFIEIDENILRLNPTESGDYALTVKVAHNDGTSDTKTIDISVKDRPATPEEIKADYGTLIVIFFVLAVGAIAVIIFMDKKDGKIDGKFPKRAKTRVGGYRR